MTTFASILAVGSELLSGQIANGNAAWLSSRLFALGIDTKRHVVVDDDRADIAAALASLTQDVDLVFVTGGLGPTSDDLTRDGACAWADLPLEFHAPSWLHVEELFKRIGATPGESNKQQCFFPAGASVLTNHAGTANAFMLKIQGKEVWVLPGPPREVEAIWQDHIEPALAGRIPPQERKCLRKWRTIGKGESHLAELVAPILAKQPVEVAYRVHAPYVELKLRFAQARATEFTALCREIDMALRPWLFETDELNIPELLCRRLVNFASVDVYDGITQGHLGEVLSPYLRDLSNKGPRGLTLMTSWESHELPTAFVKQALDFNPESEVALAVAGPDPQGGWAFGFRLGEQRVIQERSALYHGEAMRPRNLKAIAFLAVKAWYDLFAIELN